MNSAPSKFERRLKISSIFIIAGLVIELITLHWAHPTAFLFFLIIGGALMIAGILLYLFSLVLYAEKPI